jgi:hypothetical protein
MRLPVIFSELHQSNARLVVVNDDFAERSELE